jgi:hypothetical protein
MVLLAAEALRTRRLKKADRPVSQRRRWPWQRWGADDAAIDVPDAVDATDASAAAAADADFNVRPWIRPAGVIAFVLWEAFWISEIFEMSSSGRPLQLPYIFLLAVMVGVPAAAYYLSRKWLAPDVEA